MRAYLEIFRTTIAEYLVYRLSFVLWRVRTIITLLIRYYLWLAIFEKTPVIFGYTESHMLTYILLSSVISHLVLSTKTADVAGEIVGGKIINYILKPVSFFKYQIAKDLADKFLNISFAVFEIAILIFLLKPPLFLQTDITMYIYMIYFVIIGLIISFFINISLSFIGFWTPEVWGPRFIFFMLILFFSGTYFPLDILPTPLYYATFLTPFPYFFFLPSRIYLGLPPNHLVVFAIFGAVWVFISYYATKQLWLKGVRQFSFFGR